MNPAAVTARIWLACLIIFCGLSACSSQVVQTTDDSILLATTPAPLEETWAVDWWIPRHEEKLAARDPGIDLVMIGDSITHRWEESGKEVWSRHFGDIATLNLGFSGDRTENVLWRLEHGEIEGLNPELVVMMIGTNNTGHRMDPPEAIAAGVEKILDDLKTRLPGTDILLLAIFPRGASPSDPMRLNNERANHLLAGVAASAGVVFANINPAFLTNDGVLETAVMPDLLHPEETGYEIWAVQMAPWFEKYLDR